MGRFYFNLFKIYKVEVGMAKQEKVDKVGELKDVFKDLNLKEVLKGPTSIVVSGEDMIATAKVLEDFSKDLDVLKVKAGIFENRLLNPEEVEKFASLPGREVLLTNLVISIKSPITKLVNVLSALTRDLVLVLNAVREKKEKYY